MQNQFDNLSSSSSTFQLLPIVKKSEYFSSLCQFLKQEERLDQYFKGEKYTH